MQEAMFTGVFASLSAEHSMANIANNLANVNTNGYKRDMLAFKDTMIQFAHDQIMEPLATVRSKPLFPEPQLAARVRLAVAKTEFEQGSLQTTSNPLDVAISGQGFFRIGSPSGEQLSRNGAFVITSQGQLSTKQGWPVLGDGGAPIVVPEGTGNVHIDDEGRVYADGGQVGTLALVTVEPAGNLEKLGGNLYRVRPDTVVTQADAYTGGSRVNQGFLEASNVEVVSEMVNMIQTQRYFEAVQKSMQSSDSTDREAISKIGRAR